MPVSGITLAATVADQVEAFFVPSRFKDEAGQYLYPKCRWILMQIKPKQEGRGDCIDILEKGHVDLSFEDLVSKLSEMPAAYVVHEFKMPVKDQSSAGHSSYPIFITWVNDNICSVSIKMKMSSSESVIKERCKGHCKIFLSCHDVSELNTKDVFAALSLKVDKY